MNVNDVVMIIVGVVNILLLGLVFSVFKESLTQKILIAQMHVGMGTLTGRIVEQAAYLQKVGAALSDLTNSLNIMVDKLNDGPAFMNSRMGMMYKTLDGKYTAPSLESLITKIKKDGVEENYLSPEEMENIKKMFENDEFNDDDSDLEYGMDDDEDDFNPDSGKF